MKSVRGFSLIELMIAVAIVGILAAIALPSYNKSVIKTNRGVAKAFLMEAAQKEQAYLLDQRSYATKAQLTAIGLKSSNEFDRYYTWDVAVGTGAVPTFTVTATPKSGTKQSSDGSLSLDQAGVKTSNPSGKWDL